MTENKQSDEILERIISFIPELSKEIEIREDGIWISRKGVEMLKLKVNPKLLGEIFEEDC